MSTLRLYTFCNFYLSSIQQGIQTAHIVGELHNNFQGNTYFEQWCRKDKTIIVCNGGMAKDLYEAYLLLSGPKQYLPITCFEEEAGALDIKGAESMTGFGIIVPEYIYDAEVCYRKSSICEGESFDDYRYYIWDKKDCSGERKFYPNDVEATVYDYIKSRSLAR